MKTLLRLVAALVLLSGISVSASAQSIPPLSTWKNQRGSILTIWWVSGGEFKGSFTNFATGFQCQGIPYPASGHTNPDGSLLFIVNFTNCNTVTTWWGRLNGNQIPTKWSLVYVDSATGLPHKMFGKDGFTLQ